MSWAAIHHPLFFGLELSDASSMDWMINGCRAGWRGLNDSDRQCTVQVNVLVGQEVTA